MQNFWCICSGGPTNKKQFSTTVFTVYNTHPYFGLHLKKKKRSSRKQRKWLRKTSVKTSWLENTQKTTTWSSLQKSHSMHQARKDQFFRWNLSVVSHCEIMDTFKILGTPIWLDMQVRGPRMKNPSAIPVTLIFVCAHLSLKYHWGM